MKKIGRTLFLILLAVLAFHLTILAAEETEEPKIDVETPESIREYLPFDFEEMSADELLGAFDFRFFSELGVRILVEAVPEAARTFSLLLGLFLIAALLNAVKDTLAVPTLQTAMGLVSMLCMSGAIFSATETVFDFAEGYIETLGSFLRSVTPTMAAFMAASGSFTSASVISGVIFLALSLLDGVVSGVLFPLIRLSLCLSVVSSVFGISGISGIVPYLRKLVSYVFGFVTVCLSAVLMFQNMIARSADSLALKGIRFAIGNFVPFVGGAVNEALSTVVGGLNTIRTATGVVGAVIVGLLAAVPVIRMILQKTFLELLSFCSGLLGLSGEMRLMSEVSSFFGYAAALMAITAVFFVLALSMMATA